MNGGALLPTNGRKWGGPVTQSPGPGPYPRGVMTSAVTAFLAAVGGTSLICYLLMNRVQNRSARRHGTPGDSAGSGTSYDSGSDGWSIFSWFSSDTSSSDSSGPRAIGAVRTTELVAAVTAAAVVEMAAGAVINAAARSRRSHVRPTR